MDIEQIKTEMLNYKDFFGGDIPDTDAINNAKTKRELERILEKHRQLMENMLADAHRDLNRFKDKLGLSILV